MATVTAAVFAPVSQAATVEFHCVQNQTANCIIRTESTTTSYLKLGGGSNIACNFDVAGEMPKNSPTVTVNEQLTSCKVFGINLPVEMNGCTFTYHAPVSYIAWGEKVAAVTDINCPAGKEITIHTGSINCTWTIGSQSGLNGVLLNNTGTRVAMSGGLEGISYTNSGTECFNAPGVHSDGGLVVMATLRAFEANNQIAGRNRAFEFS